MHYRPFHRAVHRPQGAVHFRQLFQPRSLVIVLPLLACLLFSGLYGLPHTLSVSRHSAAATSHATPSSSASHATSAPSTKNDSSSTNSTNSNSTSAPSSASSASPGKPTTPGPAVSVPLPSCDQAAQAAAIATEQTALNAESSRHNATLTLLGVTNDATNLLLPKATQAKVEAENALHTTALQQIQAVYRASVTAAHC